MAYIYLITNDINGKQYVGKTYKTIEQRWKEHLGDRTKRELEKRPLYDAMNKYGIEHFHIKEVEYVPPEINLEEREIYWIAQYNTYYNGYNATLGGDGSRLYDYNLIVEKYNELQNMAKVAKELNISKDTVRVALRNSNIQIIPAYEITKKQYQKAVAQYDLQNNYIQEFECLYDAARSVINQEKKDIKGAASHIADVCKGKRKTAYKYKWKFVDKN